MARPHILIIPPWFDIDFRHHFSKSYHRWASDLAQRNEAEVGLLYGDFRPGLRPHRKFVQPDVGYQYLGVRSWGFPKVGWAWKFWERQYLHAFGEYVERYGRPSVLHGFSLLGVIAAYAIHRKFRIPYVYTEVLGSMISGKVAPRLIKKARTAVQNASLVCGISPGMVSALKQHFGVSPQLITLYIDSAQFPATPFPSGPVHFISIGSPATTKGMDILIAAMNHVRDTLSEALLTIMCEKRDDRYLEELIRHYGLESCVHLHGPVPHDTVATMLRDSHVLVSASREESLGYTMIEALSCGRPVVASSTPGARYIVGKEVGQLVEIREGAAVSPVSLARAMLEVAGQLDRYVPANLHHTARQRFGKDEILGTWAGIYAEVSNSGP